MQRSLIPVSAEILANLLRDYEQGKKDTAQRFDIGRSYLELADTDHWEYLDKALEYLSQVGRVFPKDPVVMMLKGRAVGAKALKASANTLRRLGWARDGFKMMDKAVQLEKDCYYLRLLRAEAALMAHPVLRRAGRLQEDVKYLESFAKKAEFEVLPAHVKSRIALFMGNHARHLKHADKARDHWHHAIKLDATSPYATEARQRLDGTFRDLGYTEES